MKNNDSKYLEEIILNITQLSQSLINDELEKKKEDKKNKIIVDTN